tara:strand:+ start:16626 stop:16892 length:267 start_codon:yes stop_codon:yes gene_type:complete
MTIEKYPWEEKSEPDYRLLIPETQWGRHAVSVYKKPILQSRPTTEDNPDLFDAENLRIDIDMPQDKAYYIFRDEEGDIFVFIREGRQG